MTSQRLATITATLDAEKEKIADELKRSVDAYWAIWRKTNSDIVTKRHKGDTSRKQGSLAPSVRIRKESDGGAVTVRWRNYSNNYARLNLANKESLKYAKELPRNKSGITDTRALLRVAEKWERELVIEILNTINPLILEMSAVHEAIKKIKTVERQLLKTTKAQE